MNILNYLQKIGRALMVPVATLPTAAILMGIGYWIDPTGWGSKSALAAFFIQSGSAIINNMSLLFAIGVAYGMSKDKNGTAALSGFVGFIVVTTLCMPTSISMIQKIPLDQVSSAFNKINNQFIGILVGIISAEIYNRFSDVQLTKVLAFFNGRRLIPILISFVMLVVSLILMYIWPLIFNMLLAFGEKIQQLGSLGAGIYAFFNRLLIPLGLHHALNSVFWFDVIGINDIPKFLGGQHSIDNGTGIIGITGRYQAGFFPVMMFGLPGAALAVYSCAYDKNRNKIAGIILTASFTSFFTGITEPLEFFFIFVTPLLYFLHAFLTGLSVFIAAKMQWIAGFGFSAGLIDMVLSSNNPLATHWYMLILQGLLFFVIYYILFYFAIKYFNLMTPGRELHNTDINHVSNSSVKLVDNDNMQQKSAHHYIHALGGANNIVNIDACITRLRVEVKDITLVNKKLIKDLSIHGSVYLDQKNLQIIIGTEAENIAKEMCIILKFI